MVNGKHSRAKLDAHDYDRIYRMSASCGINVRPVPGVWTANRDLSSLSPLFLAAAATAMAALVCPLFRPHVRVGPDEQLCLVLPGQAVKQGPIRPQGDEAAGAGLGVQFPALPQHPASADGHHHLRVARGSKVVKQCRPGCFGGVQTAMSRLGRHTHM